MDGTSVNMEGGVPSEQETGGVSSTKPKRWARLTTRAREIRKQFDLGLEILSRQVLSGQKPGAYINFRDPKIYEKYGLEAIPVGLTLDGTTHAPNELAIALRGRTVESVIKKRGVPQAPEIQEKIDDLLGSLEGRSIAQALASLHESPVNNGLELPEVAAAEGLLLGYKLCDVKYYIDTRHFGKLQYREGYAFTNHVICEDCYKGKSPDKTT